MSQDSKPIADKLPFWRQLRWTLVAIFFILALLPVAAVTFITITQARQQRTEQVIEQLTSIAELKRGQITSWLDAGDATLSMFLSETARAARFETFVRDSQNQGDTPSAAYSAEQDALNRILSDAVKAQTFFQEVFVYTSQGDTVASSDDVQIGKTVAGQPYFKPGLEQDLIQPPYYPLGANELTMVIIHRMIDQDGQLAGVLAGRLNMKTLSNIMTERTGLESGETYLVSLESHYLITRSRYEEEEDLTLTQRYQSYGIDRALGEDEQDTERDGSGVYDSYRDVTVIGVYRWLPELQVAMLAESNRADALAAADRTRNLSIFMAVLAALVAIGAGILFSARISEPIVELTQIAAQIAGGDLEQRAPAQRYETGLLATAFNSMAEQLQNFIGSLEQRISERTRNLQTASEVSRATSSVLDPDELLREVVNLVRERFGLYYVGLFLLDPKKHFAVLRAGTGQAGREMLAQGHRLEVGGSSMIGRCITREEASVALRVGAEDIRRYANPHLPDTRSEMAMPMRSRGEVVGAMTVQSDQEAAFDETDIAVMQTMADQVGVALDNARLFSETQAALEEAAATHRRYLRRTWSEYTKVRTVSGYQQIEGDLAPLGEQILPPVQQALVARSTPGGNGSDDASPGQQTKTLAEPIVLRGQPIGALGFSPKAGARPWSDDDVALVQTVASQLAQAIENLRLTQETERRAAREQLISSVTSRMRESLDMDTVLRITTQEMRESLGLHSVMIQLEIGDESQDQAEELDEDMRAVA